jgi:hypothetical protein
VVILVKGSETIFIGFFLAVVFCSCRAHEKITSDWDEEDGFQVVGEPIYHPVENPFHEIPEHRIVSIAVSYESGESVVITNRSGIEVFRKQLAETQFKYELVEMTADYLSEQRMLDQDGAVLGYTAVNTDDGEVVFMSSDGVILGVGENRSLWLLVKSWKEVGNMMAP